MKLREQIAVFINLGYTFNYPFDVNNFINVIKSMYSDLSIEEIELFFEFPDGRFISKKPYHSLYFHLGCSINNTDTFITNNCLWWDLEAFDIDGRTEFIKFMERMGIMSRGELKFTEIICYDNNGDDDKYMEFKVNGIYKKWHLGFDIPNSYIQRFALLCEELTTKGKFTIYDDGAQHFVLDYATEQELLNFNAITMLNRKFLIDANFFEHPID